MRMHAREVAITRAGVRCRASAYRDRDMSSGTSAPRGRSMERPPVRSGGRRGVACRGEEGFTLVELLVVVLMLVALVGIAVPTFVGQQERAERAAVQSELRTAAIALESFRARNGFYSEDALDTSAFGFVRSTEVAVAYEPSDFTATRFCVRAWYDPIEPGEVRTLAENAADSAAEWGVTEQGVIYLGDGGSSRTCPS